MNAKCKECSSDDIDIRNGIYKCGVCGAEWSIDDNASLWIVKRTFIILIPASILFYMVYPYLVNFVHDITGYVVKKSDVILVYFIMVIMIFKLKARRSNA